MTWTSLLANKEAQKHKTSKKELDNMRALIARDLADASLAGLSADRRFATAYNAALQAANMAIACAGYRIVSKVGHHRVSVGEHETGVGQSQRTSTPIISKPVGESEIRSTTLSPTLRRRRKRRRSSSRRNSFTRSRRLDYEKPPSLKM